MMEAPKCKLCGHRHWNTQPHNWRPLAHHKPKEASDAKKKRKQKIQRRNRQ